jgi:hypothetical protein
MIWQLLKTSIATAPRQWILSPVELFKSLLLPLQHQIELVSIRKQIRKNRSFDYGAKNSFRQDASVQSVTAIAVAVEALKNAIGIK